MPSNIYRFKGFRLDLVGRELRQGNAPVELPASAFDCLVYLIENRQRAVGRDELIASVWGRTDVSETLLPHTIVRLRRLLGDTGTEQNAIRTVPRVGYRWVADVTIESNDAPPPDAPVVAADALPARDDPLAASPALAPETARPAASRRRYLVPAVLLLVALVALLFSANKMWTKDAAIASVQGVVVLPARIQASSGDWAWLRLGLMDLIGNHLRSARVQAVPSETVVAVINDNPTGAAAALGAGRTALQPEVTYEDGIWTVRLLARLPDGAERSYSAQANDVLIATRNATDTFLVNSGAEPPRAVPEGVDPRLDLLQRLRSARLADRLDLAQDLAKQAPAPLLADPEVQLSIARVDCDAGRRDDCERGIAAILDGPANGRAVSVRARAGALVTRGWLYKVRGDDAKADAVLGEALAALPPQGEYDTRASALALRGWVRVGQSRLDEAARDLDTARGAYVIADDPLGIARVDRWLAVLKMEQGKFDESLALHRAALLRMERLGATREVPVSLTSIADVSEKLLQFEEQLRTTSAFWKPQNYDDAGLGMLHGWALARNGKLTDAAAIAQRLLAQADLKEHAPAVAALRVLMAYIALERRNYAQSAVEARASLASGVEQASREDHRQAWVLLIVALIDGGEPAQAREALRRMSESTAVVDDSVGQCYVAWLKARLVWHEGNRADALEKYAQAMELARAGGRPELIVEVGADYGLRLLDEGHLEAVMPIEGALSRWFDTDVRAATLHARVAEKLDRTDVAAKSFEQARRLAGERVLPGAAH
jgi:DNA-binding winged helix-turn-helix (wHTH) protein/tetratricopeptide (TPR) repeat protein